MPKRKLYSTIYGTPHSKWLRDRHKVPLVFEGQQIGWCNSEEARDRVLPTLERAGDMICSVQHESDGVPEFTKEEYMKRVAAIERQVANGGSHASWDAILAALK